MRNAPVALCTESNTSIEDRAAVRSKQASSQTSTFPSEAPEACEATGQPGTVLSARCLADAGSTEPCGTKLCTCRPPQERTVSLHRSEKSGCALGTLYALRASMQSWVQASTYRQVHVRYLWTDTRSPDTVFAYAMWQRTPLGYMANFSRCASG